MIRVEFERIGRNRNVPAMKLTGENAKPDRIAEYVHAYARRFLASRDFDVDVFDDGTGSIEFERFGTFRWHEVEAMETSDE